MMIKPKMPFWMIGLCLASTLVSAADTYHVSGVETWDTLNMRSQPGSKSAVIAKMPADAQGITLTGKQESIGKTVWKEVVWHDKQGWVSQAYLARVSAAVKQDKPSVSSKQEVPAPAPVQVAQQQAAPPQAAGRIQPIQSGSWILECGSASPYWKVEVLPEWMNLYTPNGESGVPIQYKRQEKAKWTNAAAKTELRGKRGAANADMTLVYTGNCRSSLVRNKVPFRVSGVVNGQEVSGCCRSVQVR